MQKAGNYTENLLVKSSPPLLRRNPEIRPGEGGEASLLNEAESEWNKLAPPLFGADSCTRGGASLLKFLE